MIRLVFLLVAACASPRLATHVHNDFSFHIGTWKTHVKRLLRPLTGSTSWADYEGTTRVRPVWDGRANLVELEVTGPQGHLELLSLRLYDPTTAAWSLHGASARSSAIDPAITGTFTGGRGTFIGPDHLGDRAILVRFVISPIDATSWRFEQAFSPDDGKTWEVNWIATDTRVD
ncbi:MAG: hypothetical protein ABI867_41335 [Kofleriaceae bacterium]